MMSRRYPLVIVFAFLSTVLGGAEWYRSGPGGHLGPPISSGGKANSGWTLSAEKEGDDETRTLYYNDTAQFTILLTRIDGQLVSEVKQDADGEILSRIEYLYDMDGNPRASYITTEADDSPNIHVESQSRVHADGSTLQNEYGASADWTLTNLDKFGLPVKQVVYEDGQEVRTQIWTRAEDGRLLQSATRAGEYSSMSQYDSQGYLIREEESQDDVLVRTRVYTWENGNLISVLERGDGVISQRETQWTEDGDISRETYYEDGLRTRDIAWIEPGKKIETIYKDGSAVIRVYWEDDRRRKMEFLRYGTVVRVREL